MPKAEVTESRRLWVKAVKALRQVERKLKVKPNLSKTILYLVDHYKKYGGSHD